MNPAIWERHYEIITAYRPDHNIWLLMGKEDRKIYIGKAMEVYNRLVMSHMKNLENSHIPKIFEVDEEDYVLYVVEEYISGTTLAEFLESGRIFSEKETAEIAIQICDGLTFLHSREKPIIHRDLKPSNIMVSNDQVVKLIDYNAARYYEVGMARDTRLIGTSGYAAPEQFGFAQTDARTDIYALGIVMKELLSEKQGLALRCGTAMRKIIERCTHMDPEKRYKTAAAVRRDLEHLVYGTVPVKVRIPVWNLSSLWPIPGFRSKNTAKMVLAVVGYIIIFGIASGMNVESNQEYPVIWMLDKICVGAWMLFLVALATDYLGIKNRFSLVNHPNKLVQLVGFVLWGLVVMVFAAIFPEIVQTAFF